MNTEVTLYRTNDERGFSRATATLAEDGRLVIEGQDLGKAVKDFFGSREYEYALEAAASDIDRCVALLGGDVGTDILDVLRAWVARGEGEQAQQALTKAGLIQCTWNRMGD